MIVALTGAWNGAPGGSCASWGLWGPCMDVMAQGVHGSMDGPYGTHESHGPLQDEGPMKPTGPMDPLPSGIHYAFDNYMTMSSYLVPGIISPLLARDARG